MQYETLHFFQPFFLYLAYQATHGTLEVPPRYTKPYEDTIRDDTRRLYAGVAACMDEGVDNVTRALKETGLYDNTVIIFSTGIIVRRHNS